MFTKKLPEPKYVTYRFIYLSEMHLSEASNIFVWQLSAMITENPVVERHFQ